MRSRDNFLKKTAFLFIALLLGLVFLPLFLIKAFVDWLWENWFRMFFTEPPPLRLKLQLCHPELSEAELDDLVTKATRKHHESDKIR